MCAGSPGAFGGRANLQSFYHNRRSRSSVLGSLGSARERVGPQSFYHTYRNRSYALGILGAVGGSADY